jgi:hypothetical protein
LDDVRQAQWSLPFLIDLPCPMLIRVMRAAAVDKDDACRAKSSQRQLARALGEIA